MKFLVIFKEMESAKYKVYYTLLTGTDSGLYPSLTGTLFVGWEKKLFVNGSSLSPVMQLVEILHVSRLQSLVTSLTQSRNVDTLA